VDVAYVVVSGKAAVDRKRAKADVQAKANLLADSAIKAFIARVEYALGKRPFIHMIKRTDKVTSFGTILLVFNASGSTDTGVVG
jgi:hypothetical protein